MQKLISVLIDTDLLIKKPDEPFTINEVDSINDELQDGWEIEDWDIIKEDSGDGQVALLVILNDAGVTSEDEELFSEEDASDEEKEDSEEDTDSEDSEDTEDTEDEEEELDDKTKEKKKNK